MSRTGGDPTRDALEQAIGFQYEVTRLLGRGGMGAVYHAHERALDRPVAIKVLPPEVAATPDARERFLREARTAARLTHPNIVPLFTFGETAGLIYFVMGYVEGESLEQRLRRSGPIELDEATRILTQLASALDYAHQQGIVHRDVKPDNVLLEHRTGIAKLTDFGIAKRSSGGETLTGTGMLLGTPRYMSPEQASGDELDARSDIYALGLVGYAMLLGRPPFDGQSVQEILVQQVTRDAPALRAMLPQAPSAVCRAIDRALSKDPAQRWASGAEMAGALMEEDADEEPPAAFGQAMRRPGVYALSSAVSAVLLANVAWWVGMTENEGAGNLFTVLLVIFTFGTLFDYASARWKEKQSPDELRRLFTEPPRWWPFWWPARWRRRDDIWARLPPDVRTIRLIGSAGIGLFAAGAELTFLAVTAQGALPKAVTAGGAIAASVLFAGSLLTLFVSAARGWWWGRRTALSSEDTHRFLSAPTARVRFWSKPHIAALLLARGRESPAAVQPRSPSEIARAIGAAAARLPQAQRSAVGDVGAAAGMLAASIHDLDQRLARHARDFDPAEIGRLESRLAALGDDDGAESNGMSEMRRLYQSQLDLLRRLSTEGHDLQARRDRYAQLIRTLWLQIEVLVAQLGSDEPRGETTDQLRGIIENIGQEIAGAVEASSALKSPVRGSEQPTGS